MTGDSDKPIVLYGEGGCGKTSLLAKSAGLTSSEWFAGARPISIIRFLGTTPDSSALTPTLISICQQVFFFFFNSGLNNIHGHYILFTAYIKPINILKSGITVCITL